MHNAKVLQCGGNGSKASVRAMMNGYLRVQLGKSLRHPSSAANIMLCVRGQL